MSVDLQELFNAEGLGAPLANLDTDYVIRRGRRVRARRRAATGATAFVGVGVVAVASVALAGSTPFAGQAQPGIGVAAGTGLDTTSSITATETTRPSSTATPSSSSTLEPGTPTPSGTSAARGTPPVALAAVALPNPAPGFPIRRWRDDVVQEGLGSGPSSMGWVAEFGLGMHPDVTTTSAAGTTSGTPNGPEVSMFVGEYSTPIHLSGLGSRPVAGSPAVAGVVGHLAEYTEKGTTFSVLYFSTGKFTVEIIGTGVTTAQLVTLGDALTGLQ